VEKCPPLSAQGRRVQKSEENCRRLPKSGGLATVQKPDLEIYQNLLILSKYY